MIIYVVLEKGRCDMLQDKIDRIAAEELRQMLHRIDTGIMQVISGIGCGFYVNGAWDRQVTREFVGEIMKCRGYYSNCTDADSLAQNPLIAALFGRLKDKAERKIIENSQKGE